MKFHPVILAFLASSAVAPCATFTWTGAADGNWNNATNWSVGIPASAATTALVFDNAVRQSTSNNITGGLTLNSLTIGAASPARNFTGNLLTFAGISPQITRANGTGNVFIGNNVQLDASVRFVAPVPFTSQIGIAGVVSGTGGIIAHEGISVLSGSNTYSGATVVRDKALFAAAGGGVAATSGISVETGGEFQLLKDTFVNRPLALSGALTSSAKQNVFFGGTSPSCNYSGAISVIGDSEIRAFTGTGGSLENQVDFPVSGAVTLSSGKLITSTSGPGNALRFTSVITGTGDIAAESSNGTLDFEEINVNGTVSSIGAGGDCTVKTLAGNGLLEIDVDSGFSGMTITGAVSGNRNVAVLSGLLELEHAANSFIGNITLVEGGSLTAQTNASLGPTANPLMFHNGGLLTFTSSGNLANPITTTGGSGLFSSPGFSGTISSTITGPGGFGFVNFGQNAIYTLTGTNTFQGGLDIGTGAIVAFSQDSNLGAAGGTLRLSGGSLSLPPALAALSRPIVLNGGGISASAGSTHSLTGNISGAGRFVLGGGATFVLAGASSFTGQLAVIGQNGSAPSVVVVDGDARLGAASATLQLGEQSGIFVRSGVLRATADLDISATRNTTYRAATVDTNGFNITFNQPLSGRGLAKTGAGVLRLNTVNPDATGENDIAISQGILRLGINNAFGTRARVASMTGDAVLDLNGFSAELATLENVEPTTEVRLGSGQLTIRTGGGSYGAITGTGSVVIGKSGFSPASITLGGVNTFSGGLTVTHGGRLTLQNAASLGAPGNPITLDNGTLSTGSLMASPLMIDSSVNLTIGPGGARFSAGGQSIIIGSLLSGTNPIRFGGGSSPFETDVYDVRLVNPANTFTGPIQIGQSDSDNRESVIIGIVANGSLGNAANGVTLGGSYFDGESTRTSSGGLRAYADLTIPATRAIQLEGEGAVLDSNGHIFTVASPISELSSEQGLRKEGEGSLILNGANTYTGETFVRRGTLGGTGSVGGSLRLDSDATLAPGAPAAIGTFTCADIDLTGGGTYLVNLASGSGSDRIVANGEVSISPGATIVVQPTGPVTQGDIFTIFQKSTAGPINGTFEQTGNLSSGDIQWSINYAGGDGNDITITALTGSAPAATVPKLSNLVITPAGASGPGVFSGISATISGGQANGSVLLEASTDLGVLDPWEVIRTIPLNASGAATLNNVTDPNSGGAKRNFFRLRVP